MQQYRHRRFDPTDSGRMKCAHTALRPIWVNEFPDGSVEADSLRCVNCETILVRNLHPERFGETTADKRDSNG